MKRATWFITGASSGFAAAFAEFALSEGHNVVIAARRKEKLDRIAATHPERVLAVETDVTNTQHIHQLDSSCVVGVRA